MYKVRRCPTLNFPQFLESGTLFPGILEQGIFPHVLALPSTIICRSPSDLAIVEPQSCFGNQRQVFFASDSLEFSFQNSPLRFFEIWRTTMAIVVWLHNAHFCLICIQQKRFLRVQGGVSSEAKNPILQNETIFQGVVLTVLYRTFTIVSRGLKIDWILFSAANIQMRLTIKCILYGLKVD